jgi:hypothetical protein
MCACLWLPPRSLIPSCVMFMQLLSWGNTNRPALLVEGTREREAAATAEAARVMVVLAIETSTHEATVAWGGATLRVKDAEDWPALVEREAWERASRVEAEIIVALASAHEMPKALSGRSPSLTVSLRRSAGPDKWLTRIPTAYLKRRLMPSVGGRCVRGSARSNLRSSPFCRPEAPSYATPLSVPHK